mmetsp:Transcript_45615/g.105877  ORF Transcript_45615/g.105877 Transcript_45615/m.105877 type:complete len:296 (+) Transcript_45615:711-1598(+)
MVRHCRCAHALSMVSGSYSFPLTTSRGSAGKSTATRFGPKTPGSSHRYAQTHLPKNLWSQLAEHTMRRCLGAMTTPGLPGMAPSLGLMQRGCRSGAKMLQLGKSVHSPSTKCTCPLGLLKSLRMERGLGTESLLHHWQPIARSLASIAWSSCLCHSIPVMAHGGTSVQEACLPWTQDWAPQTTSNTSSTHSMSNPSPSLLTLLGHTSPRTIGVSPSMLVFLSSNTMVTLGKFQGGAQPATTMPSQRSRLSSLVLPDIGLSNFTSTVFESMLWQLFCIRTLGAKKMGMLSFKVAAL